MNVITVTNAVGNVANRVLVKAGHEQGKWHFYCGKKRDSKCLRGVCDPKCGPKDGCNCNACALLDNTVPLPYMDPSSISNEKVNRKGHKAKKVLVTSGHEKDKYHYYCGHKRDTVCSYDRCNDICGPSSGCNCHSCAELDRYDGLPPISLAPVASSSNSNSNKALCNRNGHPVTLVAVSSGHEAGKQHHYCGKKRDTACPAGGCNNICGPKNGCNCSACKELDYRVFSQPVSNPPVVVFSHAPPVQYQAPQVQYTAPPSQLQYQSPPPQYQNQLPPQYYPALPPQPPQQSQPYPPQQYQVPPQQYQVPQQYQNYPQPSAPPQGPPSYTTQAPPTYTPTPYTPQGPPQGQVVSNNNNSATATSSPKSSTTTSTAGAAAATAAAVVSTGFKLLKPVVKATASAATSLVKSAAHHIVDNDKDNSCVICMEKPKNASLVHGQTAHQCCCLECGELLKKSGQSCPICRAPIAAVIRNYSS